MLICVAGGPATAGTSHKSTWAWERLSITRHLSPNSKPFFVADCQELQIAGKHVTQFVHDMLPGSAYVSHAGFLKYDRTSCWNLKGVSLGWSDSLLRICDRGEHWRSASASCGFPRPLVGLTVLLGWKFPGLCRQSSVWTRPGRSRTAACKRSLQRWSA